MSEMQVRDRRRPGFFLVENHVLDRYAKVVGVTAWAIYCTLCRRAYSGKAMISVADIAKIWGVSLPTVKRATRKLEKAFLIRKKKTQSITMIDLLSVEQLDFADKLTSREITSDPPETNPERSPVIPRKDHPRSLGEITSDPPIIRKQDSTRLNKRQNSAGSKARLSQNSKEGERGANPSLSGSENERKFSLPKHGYSQDDFDERDFRKWRKEMDKLEEVGSGPSTFAKPVPPEFFEERVTDPDCPKCKGLGRVKRGDDVVNCIRCFKLIETPNPAYAVWIEKQDEEWVRNAKRAGSNVGILPRRLKQVLHQVYPSDPKLQML